MLMYVLGYNMGSPYSLNLSHGSKSSQKCCLQWLLSLKRFMHGQSVASLIFCGLVSILVSSILFIGIQLNWMIREADRHFVDYVLGSELLQGIKPY